MDKFLAHIKVSLFAGVLLSSPLCLYQVWSFVRPGLYKNEKPYLVLFLLCGSLLFLLGNGVCVLCGVPGGLRLSTALW